MRIKNTYFNTVPFAFHHHGRPALCHMMQNTTPEGYEHFLLKHKLLESQHVTGEREIFKGRKEMINYIAPSPRAAMDNPLNDKLHILTINNTPERGSAVRCMEHFGMQVTQLGKDIEVYGHETKIPILIEHIPTIDKEYTMFMDADDIFFTEDPTNLVNTFEREMSCSMLCNGDAWFFPKGLHLKHELYLFQVNTAEEYDERSPYKYLNSGLWIARTDFLQNVFLPRLQFWRSAWLHADDDPTFLKKPYSDCDQALFHYTYHDLYPQLRVDVAQRYFQSYSWSRWCEWHYPGRNALEVCVET